MGDFGQKPVGREYKGHSGIARESPWLTHEDLLAVGKRELTVTIEKVIEYRNVKFDGGRNKPICIALKFVKGSRELVLNRTNTKTLNKMFGYDTTAWFGQKITLFVTDTKAEGGEVVECIRIRERQSQAVKSADDFLGGGEKAGESSPPVTAADALDHAADILDLTTTEFEALLTKHGGDRAAAANELSGRVDEKLAKEA